MKITDVKTILLTGPSGNDPFLKSLRKHRSAAFIEIHTDKGLIGIGETYMGYHAPELVPSIVEFFKPILLGLDEKEINPRLLWQRMYHCGNFWGRIGAGAIVLAGLEGALWDLKGKMLGLPVHELLGGSFYDQLPCYATGCHSNYPWDKLTQQIDNYREAGFTGAKVAAGWFDPDTGECFNSQSDQAWAEMESEKLGILRKHFGKEFILCLDGHMSNVEDPSQQTWNLGTAKKVLKALEPYDLFFFEEPLHYNNMSGYAELCQATSVSIAGGECLTTKEEFLQYANHQAFDIAQIDASYIGISPFLDSARIFADTGKRIATHAWSSGAGVMENIHAAFAVPNVAILEVPPLAGEMHTAVYADGYRFEKGYILKPEAPGLGVQLTEALKNKYPFIPGSGEWNQVPGMPECM